MFIKDNFFSYLQRILGSVFFIFLPPRHLPPHSHTHTTLRPAIPPLHPWFKLHPEEVRYISTSNHTQVDLKYLYHAPQIFIQLDKNKPRYTYQINLWPIQIVLLELFDISGDLNDLFQITQCFKESFVNSRNRIGMAEG